MSAADRSTDSAPFDLQLLPPDKVLRSRFPKALDAERAEIADTAWVEDALDDLRFPGSNGLRAFLRRVGGDVGRGRESFASLCRLHVMLERLGDDDATIDEAIQLLDRAFEPGQARFVRTAVTQAAAARVGSLDPDSFAFLVRNLEFLGSEPPAETLRNIGAAVWHRQLVRVHEMLNDTGPAHFVAKAAIEAVPLDALIAGIESVPSLFREVLEARPEIVGATDFWMVNDLNVRAALAVAASAPSLAQAAAGALVGSGRADLAYAATEALGALCVGRAVLAVDHPLNVVQPWYEAVAAQPLAVAELFAGHAARIRQSLVQFARAMQPDSLPNEVGDDPWITAIATSRGDVSEQDNSYFRAFILARAISNRSHAAAELAIQTFELVHTALAQREMPEDGWRLIQKRLPGSWSDWDRCGRVREAIGKLFAERDFPPFAFHRLTANNELFRWLALSLSWSSLGRDYLKTVRKATKSLGDPQYLPRVKILDKIL